MEHWSNDIIIFVVIGLMVLLVWKFGGDFPEDPRVPGPTTTVEHFDP